MKFASTSTSASSALFWPLLLCAKASASISTQPDTWPRSASTTGIVVRRVIAAGNVFLHSSSTRFPHRLAPFTAPCTHTDPTAMLIVNPSHRLTSTIPLLLGSTSSTTMLSTILLSFFLAFCTMLCASSSTISTFSIK